MTMFRVFVFIALGILLSNCTAPTKVRQRGELSGPRVVSFASNSGYEEFLEEELLDRGFKTKGYASQKRITNTINKKTTEEYNLGTAKYSITINGGRIVDTCAFSGSAIMVGVVMRVIDNNNSDVVLSVRADGVDIPCGGREIVWTKLADSIDMAWK